MIISHKHKFIFIKTQKTASTSIEIALSSICGKDDIITPISKEDEKIRSKMGYIGPQNYFIPLTRYKNYDYYRLLFNGKRLKYYNHMPAEKIQMYVTQDIWNNYYKFTFERNPYDKVISYFYYVNGHKRYSSFKTFLLEGGLKNLWSFYTYSIGGVPAVDKIYKYEKLEKELERLNHDLNLREQIKLPEKRIKENNKRKRYHDIIDLETRKILKITFARELELLHYDY